MSDANSKSTDVLRRRLDQFYKQNASSAFATEGDHGVIIDPLGDPGLEIPVYDGDIVLIDALNCVTLPTRFAGVWHVATRDLELPVNNPFLLETPGSYEFAMRQLDKTTMCHCDFGDSTNEMRLIFESTVLPSFSYGVDSRAFRLGQSGAKYKEFANREDRPPRDATYSVGRARFGIS